MGQGTSQVSKSVKLVPLVNTWSRSQRLAKTVRRECSRTLVWRAVPPAWWVASTQEPLGCAQDALWALTRPQPVRWHRPLAWNALLV